MGLSLSVSRDWHQTKLRLSKTPTNKISYLSFSQEFKPCLALEPYRTAQVEGRGKDSTPDGGEPWEELAPPQLLGKPPAWGCTPRRAPGCGLCIPGAPSRWQVLPHPQVPMGQAAHPSHSPMAGVSSVPGHSHPCLCLESIMER